MKNLKIILSVVVLLTVLIVTTNGQTNVSGGIYSNTTWTLANSPYIVVDTVVVFPGVTLTIEPGVLVKFENNKRLEIREASLIAEGIITDSITFTSNSVSPTAGIWASIYLNHGLSAKFNYCNVRYSNKGINLYEPTGYDSLTLYIKNSNFINNHNGYYAYRAFVDSCDFLNNTNGIAWHTIGMINYCRISNNQTGMFVRGGGGVFVNNCIINSNNVGIDGTAQIYIKNCIVDSNSVVGITLTQNWDSVLNCQIKHNGIGLYSYGWAPNVITNNVIENNNIGIKLEGSGDSIYCNKICNNNAYDLYYNTTGNTNISNNYWCTEDSATIAAHIYDGYDNISLGLVTFMPADTTQCYIITGIKESNFKNFSYSIFPNPALNYLTICLPDNNSKSEMKIYNLIGQLEFTSKIENQKTNIDISGLTKGIYIIEITISDDIKRSKFIKL